MPPFAMRERLFGKLDEKPADDRAEVVLKRYLSPPIATTSTMTVPLPAVIGEVGTHAHAPVLADEIELSIAELEKHVSPSPSLSRRHLALGLIALMYGGLSMDTDPARHANPMGTLHGGVICDLADLAMGGAFATTLLDGESFTTLDLTTKFFKPIWKSHLKATATVTKRNKSIGLVECEVTDERFNERAR